MAKKVIKQAGWYKPKALHVTFEGIGYPELWVDLKRIGSYLYGKSQEYANLPEDAPREVQEGILAGKIMGWNLLDPVTGESLDVPTETNIAPLSRLPNEFLFVIQRTIEIEGAEARTEGLVKKGIETPPGAVSAEFTVLPHQDGL